MVVIERACACGWLRPLIGITRTDGAGLPTEDLSVRYDCPQCGRVHVCEGLALAVATHVLRHAQRTMNEPSAIHEQVTSLVRLAIRLRNEVFERGDAPLGAVLGAVLVFVGAVTAEQSSVDESEFLDWARPILRESFRLARLPDHTAASKGN